MNMQQKPPVVYSNVVNLRTTATELVMDFGCFIPEQGTVPIQSIEFDVDVRVILSVSGLLKLAEMLYSAAQAHQAQITALGNVSTEQFQEAIQRVTEAKHALSQKK